MTLSVKGIAKNFKRDKKNITVLDEVDLEIKKGEFICLLGPSGCGKSTLLNIIAGLEKSNKGQVFLNNKEVKQPGPDRAVMFQDSALFPWLRVIDNVEFGMKMAGVPAKERKERALEYLKMVHLSKFKNAFVHELSGGMRQRVALARALTLDSDVLLMDEPFAALDSQTKKILQRELQKIWWDTQKTIVFVTHSVEEAVFLADRVIIMSANPGRIKKDMRISLSRPRNLESSDLAYMTAKIMAELKEEVEKVAKAEFDNDWDWEKDNILHSADSYLGHGL